MKKLISLITIVLIVIFINNSFIFANKKAKKVGEIDFRLGELFKKNINTKEWSEIDEEDAVFYGDTIRTGVESKCEIKLIEGSTIRMSEKALYVFEKGADDYGKILHGTIWTNVKKRNKNERDFQIKTPIAVAAVIGTRFRINYDGSLSEITVLDGKVNVDLLDEKKEELKKEESDDKSTDNNEKIDDSKIKNIKKQNSSSLMKKSKSMDPTKKKGKYMLKAPKEVDGPYEVTLSEWISIVKGEVISIRQDGKYHKTKTDIKELEREWDNFLRTKK